MKPLVQSQFFLLALASLLVGCWLNGTRLKAAPLPRAPQAIVTRPNASALEWLAANEVRRYIYLRTGRLLPVRNGGQRGGDRIALGCKDEKFCGKLARALGPQQFTLRTSAAGGETTWWIVGGDELGTLYGAYRFAEKLGVRFGLDEDSIPDEGLGAKWPEMNETGKPRFSLRGLQPFHDFSVGPDWWNEQDYRAVVSQMAKLRMNFLGLHTYPSWNPSAGPEANVWIGLPEDVDARGNVRFGYEAGVVTTRRGWAVTPYPTSNYACGAGLLFDRDDYGPDFMLECLEWPRTEAAATAMFNRYGDLQQRVVAEARRLGIKTCVGTELPLGVPKALAARLEAKGMKPDDPVVIRRLYEGTFLRLTRKLPVDYYWLWTPEVWLSMEPGCPNWEMTSRSRVEQDLALAEAAAQRLGPPFGLATCGWRLGTRDDALWMDKRAPKGWAVSSIGTQLGRDPVEKAYGQMPARQRWVIGWAEDDGTAGAHCCTCWDLQFWVQRMFNNSLEAFDYGCQGMMAIHWRTAAISPNIDALARAGWDFEGADTDDDIPAGTASGRRSGKEGFWACWGRGLFGEEAGAEVGRTLQKFDGSHVAINALIEGGAKTTDTQISEFFAPQRELEVLRAHIKGSGNLARFEYWLNLVRATHLRVRTWVLAARLGARIKEAGAMQDPSSKLSFGRNEILPLRIELARNYEGMISAFIDCAKSPGELGTISSIESGSRQRIVCAHDATIGAILGQPLPSEAAVRTTYKGAPRIFIPSKCDHMKVDEPLEIRAFVLSNAKCTGVDLFWRPLGEGRYRRIAATHRARHAYRVTLPGQHQGTAEYYLEATLADGQKVLWPSAAPGINQTVLTW